MRVPWGLPQAQQYVSRPGRHRREEPGICSNKKTSAVIVLVIARNQASTRSVHFHQIQSGPPGSHFYHFRYQLSADVLNSHWLLADVLNSYYWLPADMLNSHWLSADVLCSHWLPGWLLFVPGCQQMCSAPIGCRVKCSVPINCQLMCSVPIGCLVGCYLYLAGIVDWHVAESRGFGWPTRHQTRLLTHLHHINPLQT